MINKKNTEMSTKHRFQDYLLSAREKTVLLPKTVHFDGADFQRQQDNLVIKDRNGDRAFIRNFFSQPHFPMIASENGEQMAGDLAAAFVKLSPCAVTALLEIDKVHKN